MADFLVVGLGNPGKEYRDTRHNFGFLAVDELARKMDVPFCRLSSLEAEVAVGELSSRSVALVKPFTYMNLSGRAVAVLAKFYQLREPAQIIIIHDDLDIPLGKIKIKSGGGSGGHKGVQSVIESLGTNEFLRIRLGIGLEERPIDVIDYVLTPFALEEQDARQRVVAEAANAVQMIIQDGPGKTMNFFHSRDN
ncbi:MAG: aminoacyl-tRNA hydrolase [Deltaproteobacteria bacterium]|nr:aminoacyl-tRNA hydrolase [Candidatus Tharpellaceae bacterium]